MTVFMGFTRIELVKTLASQTKRLSKPCTAKFRSTTPTLGSSERGLPPCGCDDPMSKSRVLAHSASMRSTSPGWPIAADACVGKITLLASPPYQAREIALQADHSLGRSQHPRRLRIPQASRQRLWTTRRLRQHR